MGIDEVVHDVSLRSIHLRSKARRYKQICKAAYAITDMLSERETFRLATLTPIPCSGDKSFASPTTKPKKSALISHITDTPAIAALPIKVHTVPDLYNALAGTPRSKPVWEPTTATDLPSHILETNAPPLLRKTLRAKPPHFPKRDPLVVTAERALDALYIADRANDELQAARARMEHKGCRCCARLRRSERRKKLAAMVAGMS